jgi:hypothetical protein
MKKKPSKSTAQRSAAKPARKRKAGQLALPLGSPKNWERIDPTATGSGTIVGKPETFAPGIAMGASGLPLFNLVMRKPHPRAGRAIQQELQRKQERRARQEAEAARLARRPATMQQPSYRLPADLQAWLRKRLPIYIEAEAEAAVLDAIGCPDDPRVHRAIHDAIADACDAAYRRGCIEGFIEGRVLDLEPKRERSQKANAAKRQKPREHNGMRFTLDQRDAAIVAEHAVLRPMVGATEAQLRLAEKYDLTDKMIRIIIGKARKAAR